MIYELWRDNVGNSVFADCEKCAELKKTGIIDKSAYIVLTIEDDMWKDAMKKYYLKMGWGPFELCDM